MLHVIIVLAMIHVKEVAFQILLLLLLMFVQIPVMLYYTLH